MATPADLAQALRAFCGVDAGEGALRATEMRLAGNALASSGDLKGALAKFEAAAAAWAPGAYLARCNLSAVALQLGDKAAALEHARAAAAGAPKGFHTASIRLVDALYANGLFDEAAGAADAAAAADPEFKALPEFRVIQQALASARRGGGGGGGGVGGGKKPS